MRKLAAAGTNQDQSFHERTRKPATENSDINDEDDSKLPHNYRISRAHFPHLEKVHSNSRQQLKHKPEDKMEDLDVNRLIWRMSMIVTQQAAAHLGNDYLDTLARKFVDKDESVDSPGSSAVNGESQCVL